jgi:hypothetical protein
MTSIFISYRRSDSMAYTGRIYDRLAAAFGAKNLFKDVDNIPPGKDFRSVLNEALNHANVLLVIIGPQWTLTSDDYGHRRLEDPEDFVRIEVETGLKRDDVLVIPVLVNDAMMPTAESLPANLKALAYRNGVVVRNDPDFNHDIGQLIQYIRAQTKSSPMPRILLGLLILALLAAVVVFGVLPRLNPTPTPTLAAAVLTETASKSEPGKTQSATPAASHTPASSPTSVPATPTPASTTSGPAVSPTVLYPDGRVIRLFYDQSSFYALNTGPTRLAIKPIVFERLDKNGQPAANRFEGDDWAVKYTYIEAGKCSAIEIPQFARHLQPKDCKNYNAIRNNSVGDNTIFWTGSADSTQFRVLWNGQEIARCENTATSCDVHIPPGI